MFSKGSPHSGIYKWYLKFKSNKNKLNLRNLRMLYEVIFYFSKDSSFYPKNLKQLILVFPTVDNL